MKYISLWGFLLLGCVEGEPVADHINFQDGSFTEGASIGPTDAAGVARPNVTDAHDARALYMDEGMEQRDASAGDDTDLEAPRPLLPDGEASAPVPPEPIPMNLNCQAISEANPAWEVCSVSADECAGVFTDGAGCVAFCAAAGLACIARHGGEPGCLHEPGNVMDCNADNGHGSDWCVCAVSDEVEPMPPVRDPMALDCPTDERRLPVAARLNFPQATYTQRHNWVLGCYDYAYTGHGAEHQECDAQFQPDGSRRGTATFIFENVPPGPYDVLIGGRHTENRNSAGARFLVNGQAVIIDQRIHSPERVWDLHGRYCLSGRVEVVLDSTVNSGSDSVLGVRLEPR